MHNISQIPLSKVPFLDPQNKDLVSREWYRFLNNLFTLTGSGGNDTSMPDVQVGPAPVYVDETARLQTEIDALGLHPATAPHASESRYGSFYNTTTLTAAIINTAYPITFNTTATSKGVTRGVVTSRVYVDRPGRYRVSAVLQWERTGGAAANGAVWLRTNGSDVAASAQQTRVDVGSPTSAAYEGMVSLGAGQYFELVWATGSILVQLATIAAAAPYPAVPSVRLIVSNLTG